MTRVLRRKVTVIGAGNVGATTAQQIIETGLADVVLVDIVEGLPQGKALDLLEAAPVAGYDVRITGTNDYADTAHSKIIVVTSGLARQPGMSRDDLMARNAGIVESVVKQAAPLSPGAIIIVVTNPLDAMCHVALKASGFPPERVIGMAGVLDSPGSAHSSPRSSRSACATSAPSCSATRRHDGPAAALLDRRRRPMTELMSAERVEALVERTRNGGAEVVALLKTGSAYYAPAASVVEMIEAILRDRRRVLPAPRTSAASTGSRTCTWVSRSCWATAGWRRSSRSRSPTTSGRPSTVGRLGPRAAREAAGLTRDAGRPLHASYGEPTRPRPEQRVPGGSNVCYLPAANRRPDELRTDAADEGAPVGQRCPCPPGMYSAATQRLPRSSATPAE